MKYNGHIFSYRNSFYIYLGISINKSSRFDTIFEAYMNKQIFSWGQDPKILKDKFIK